MDGYQRASIQSQWGGRGPPRDRETDMPSFDIVSEVDLHAFTNAEDQAQRGVDTRFDCRGGEAGFEREGHHETLPGEADSQAEQRQDMRRGALTRCRTDARSMAAGKGKAS